MEIVVKWEFVKEIVSSTDTPITPRHESRATDQYQFLT